MLDRIKRLTEQTFTLAATAQLYSNEDVPGEFLQLQQLADLLYEAGVKASEFAGTDPYELVDGADATAFEKVGV